MEQNMSDMSQAILADPNDDRFRSLRGRRYLDLGQYELVVEDFTKAIQLDLSDAPGSVFDDGSNFYGYWRWRAEAYEKLGRYEEAAQDRAKCKEIYYGQRNKSGSYCDESR